MAPQFLARRKLRSIRKRLRMNKRRISAYINIGDSSTTKYQVVPDNSIGAKIARGLRIKYKQRLSIRMCGVNLL
jgi:hypothetical protein